VGKGGNAWSSSGSGNPLKKGLTGEGNRLSAEEPSGKEKRLINLKPLTGEREKAQIMYSQAGGEAGGPGS